MPKTIITAITFMCPSGIGKRLVLLSIVLSLFTLALIRGISVASGAIDDRTVLFAKTWGCENWQAGFWYTRDTEPPVGEMCPQVGGGRLVLMTDPSRMGTITIIGPSGIEEEINQRDENNHRTSRLQNITFAADAQLATGLFTASERDRFVASHQSSVEADIARLKRSPGSPLGAPTFEPAGYFLVTTADIENYRAQRFQDIARAIAAARMREYHP